MKTTLTIFTLTVLCVTLICPTHSFAQNFVEGQMPDTFLNFEYVYDIKFSPDGTTLAGGSPNYTHTIILWDVASGTLKDTLEGHTSARSVAFSPDGQTLASGGSDNTVKLWDVASGTLKDTLEGHTDLVRSVAFSPDGQTLASGSDDSTIRLWNPTTGKSIEIISRPWGNSPRSERINRTINGGIRSIAFSPDGQTLASGESAVLEIHARQGVWALFPYIELWDVASGTLKSKQVLHSPLFSGPFWIYRNYYTGRYSHTGTIHISVSSVAFSPDSSTLACVVNRSSYIDLTGVIDEEKFIALQAQIMMSSQIGETYINSNDELVINESIIELWDVASGTLKATLKGHTDWVNSIAFSPDGQTLASGSWDMTVKLWDVTRQPKAPKATLSYHGGGIQSVAFSPDGSRLASGSADRAIRLWTALPPANGDGVVNIADLVEVAQNFGQVGKNNADINGDGVVNIVDLILVAVALGEVAGAPAVHAQAFSTLTAEEVEQWLIKASQLQTENPTYFRGILFLEQLLALLTPKETALLANYPNPFNPETWIPYQLAAPADVTVTIYAVDGSVVRTLALGHQSVGIYQDKSRAAYWDGKNAFGESVASGVYFYTLKAGEFTATRKMLIRK